VGETRGWQDNAEGDDGLRMRGRELGIVRIVGGAEEEVGIVNRNLVEGGRIEGYRSRRCH
jgi:hypothetical protein